MPDDPRHAHRNLVLALERLRAAEHSAVLLFAEILRRGWFRRLGHATMELYAQETLGLSLAKTHQFLRLARALEELPATRAALESGSLPWTKARTLVTVATPRTEEGWVREATESTSRELEGKVAKARVRQRRERDRLRMKRGQAALVVDPEPARPEPPVELPVTVTLTLTPTEHARFEGLLEKQRKRGDRRPRTAIVLDGLDALRAGPRGPSAAPYQIVAYRCQACNTVTVGGRAVASALAGAMACDAIQVSLEAAVPNRATIPPAVLARDGHRCTTAGCGATRFLEVHHRVPRSRGGSNAPENLSTLCHACHRFAHERDPIPPWPTEPLRSTMPRS